ncbi:MAG TPA: hypothetical protein PK402_07520 [Tepidisphaeraceae bacterium]|nr:hypothetical protein [Tepidisphaeraceae bacterium]
MTLPAFKSPNTFQRTMLAWESFAPYNAAQFATLAAPTSLNRAALESAWKKVFDEQQLERFGQKSRELIRASNSIFSHITSELNHRFAEDESPFRPFILEENGRTHVGIVYRHAVADSVSIRLLMQAWITQESPGKIDINYRDRWIGITQRCRESYAEVGWFRRMTRARRLPKTVDVRDSVTWSQHEFPDGLIDRLVAHCRARNVKMNDLFVVTAARVGARFVPFESHGGRTDAAVGTIVDLRQPKKPLNFGLALGFMHTFFTADEFADRDRALKVASHTSRGARSRGVDAATQLRLRIALWYHRRFSLEDLTDFYRKRCPLVAGMSNVNLNRTPLGDWCVQQNAIYTRVSPLGPMLPLVFTPTTIGSKMTLGLTTRDGLFDATKRTQIMDAFVDELNEIAR